MVWGEGHQLQLAVFVKRKVNSASYIAEVVNPVLLPFLQKEGDVLFQQDITHPHTAAAIRCALHGLQLPWPARSPDLSPIEHTWDMMKQELALSPEPATTIATTGARCRDSIKGKGIPIIGHEGPQGMWIRGSTYSQPRH